MVGGDRECFPIGVSIVDNKAYSAVRKRALRTHDELEYDIIEDYAEYGDQTMNEARALAYIELNAPKQVRKFFPRLLQYKSVPVAKPTYSNRLLYDAGYDLSLTTNYEELKQFPSALVTEEWVLDLEEVIPFDKFPMGFQEKYFHRDARFVDLAFDQGVSREDIKTLHDWLDDHFEDGIGRDYENTPSNWGLDLINDYPKIIDLGCFILKTE